MVALSTAALYSGVDIYTRNFLFNTDNIEAVRGMTVSALAAHSAAAFPDVDTLMFAVSSSRHRNSLLVLQAVQHGRHWAKQEARS